MGQKTETLAKRLIDLVEKPVVLFRYSAESWTTDCLVATVRHPNDQEAFYILGISNSLPGWDEQATGPKDEESWVKLSEELETWIREMNSLSKTVTIPELTGKFEWDPYSNADETPKWIFWFPLKNRYSQVRILSSKPRIIAAPDKETDKKIASERSARFANDLKAVVVKINKAQNKITKLQEEIVRLEAEKTRLEKLL